MARAAGVFDEVSRVTEKAMRGDLDFEDALRQRVALLKGLTVGDLESILGRLTQAEDREAVIRCAKGVFWLYGNMFRGLDERRAVLVPDAQPRMRA